MNTLDEVIDQFVEGIITLHEMVSFLQIAYLEDQREVERVFLYLN